MNKTPATASDPDTKSGISRGCLLRQTNLVSRPGQGETAGGKDENDRLELTRSYLHVRRPFVKTELNTTDTAVKRPIASVLSAAGSPHLAERAPLYNHTPLEPKVRSWARQNTPSNHATSFTWMNGNLSVDTPTPNASALSTSGAIMPICPLAPVEQVTDLQLARYAKLIHEKTGIRVSPQKKMLLSNRLRRRLRETGIRTFEAYYRHLNNLSANDLEWNSFFQEITTHETYLFRDENQWQWFAHDYLEQHVSAIRAGRDSRRLRIWSGACSTGDEIYTIACCVASRLPNFQVWDIDLLGTDLAIGELQRAEQGVFSPRSMHLVPKEYYRFFRKAAGSESWIAKPILRQMVRFYQHNLMKRLDEPPFDLVFLKNVLIYFDKNSKQKALQNVVPLIRPGGLLIAGAAEGVGNLSQGLKRLEPWLYQKL